MENYSSGKLNVRNARVVTIEELIKDLGSGDYRKRAVAAKVLGEIGEAAVEPLIQALRNEGEFIREEAAKVLGEIGGPAVEPLVQALKDEHWYVREKIIGALGRIGDAKAVKPLIQALKDKESNVRRRAAWALGRIGDAKAVEPLIQALKDKESNVRRRAAWALGEIGDAKAVEPLIQALKDKDSDVRGGAAWALGEIGDAKAVEPLIQALKDKESNVRREAAIALGKIKGNKEEVGALIHALGDKDQSVREAVAWALGEIGNKSAIEPLKALLYSKARSAAKALYKTRRSAAEALYKMGWEPKNDKERIYYLLAKRSFDELVHMGEISSPLIEGLLYEDKEYQEEIKRALIKMGVPAVDPLIHILEDTYPFSEKPSYSNKIEIQKDAAEILGKIGDKRAVDSLIKILKKWRKSAVLEIQYIDTIRFALGRIGDLKGAEEVIKSLLKRFPIFIEPVVTMGFRVSPFVSAEEEREITRAMSEALSKPNVIGCDYDIIRSEKRETWIKEASETLSNLFDDYTDIILSISIIEEKGMIKTEEGSNIFIYKHFDEAVKRLCEIYTPISNNILHLIVKEKDPTKRVDLGREYSAVAVQHFVELNFKDSIKIAKNELKRRGKPRYDPSVFLSKDAWKL